MGNWSKLILGVVTAALTIAQARAAPTFRLLPPVSPACISSPFGPRIIPGLPQAGTFHPGIDLPAPLGAPIRAAAAGTVIRIERRGPGGLQMLIRHPGFVGVYSHFGRIAPTFADGGRTVLAGEKLGVVGLTGVTEGPHVFFGMLVDGRAVNPAAFIGATPCRGGGEPAADGRLVVSSTGKILPSQVIVRTVAGTVIEPRRNHASVARHRARVRIATR